MTITQIRLCGKTFSARCLNQTENHILNGSQVNVITEELWNKLRLCWSMASTPDKAVRRAEHTHRCYVWRQRGSRESSRCLRQCRDLHDDGPTIPTPKERTLCDIELSQHLHHCHPVEHGYHHNHRAHGQALDSLPLLSRGSEGVKQIMSRHRGSTWTAIWQDRGHIPGQLWTNTEHSMDERVWLRPDVVDARQIYQKDRGQTLRTRINTRRLTVIEVEPEVRWDLRCPVIAQASWDLNKMYQDGRRSKTSHCRRRRRALTGTTFGGVAMCKRVLSIKHRERVSS